MTATQLPFLVEGVLILVSMGFGILLGRAGKPYGKVKLVTHLFFSLWFTVGYGFIAYGIFSTDVMTVIWAPVAIMGLMLSIQLVTGVVMMASREVVKTLPKVHIASAGLLLLSDITAFTIAG